MSSFKDKKSQDGDAAFTVELVQRMSHHCDAPMDEIYNCVWHKAAAGKRKRHAAVSQVALTTPHLNKLVYLVQDHT